METGPKKPASNPLGTDHESALAEPGSVAFSSRRTFLAAAGALTLAACSRTKGDAEKAAASAAASAASAPSKLKVGVLLPRSGLQAFVGQASQRGADVAPELLRERLGVEIEIMSADTESNVDTARSRAERLIQEGAHILVGAFDSGHTAAVAQVAEQRGVPHIINIGAAPQITEQGYKFVFRNFPTAPEISQNGLDLLLDTFRESKTAPKTAVFMHVNDTFGQAMAKGIGALLPKVTLPFKVLDTIPYDPAAKDLTVEVAKAKATKAELLLLVCRLNDAIVLRREMIKQRWHPMGVISPGSPGMYDEQFFKVLGKDAEHCITNTVWFNPKNEITRVFSAAFQKRFPNEQFIYHGNNATYTFDAVLIAADAFKRAKSTDPKALADAIRQTEIAATERVSFGGAIKFNAKGQVEGNRSVVLQNLGGKPLVVLPKEYAEAQLVFPMPKAG
jgi:branched-chain amino acid transport system substrate-binding protein